MENSQSSMVNNKLGFTLLMVNFIGVRQRARDAQRKSDLRQLQSALEIYRSDQSSYPSSITNCTCSGSVCFGAGSGSSCSPIYMQQLPTDPNGSSGYNDGSYYYYSSGGTNYCMVACLENAGDTQAQDTPAACQGAPTIKCSNNLYYIITNP
jgi:type II secretory pathway pseudopilin PulG